MPEVVGFPTAAVVVAAGVVRLLQIRPAALTHAQRHMLIAMFAVAAALVLSTPAVQATIHSFVGFPHLARLASNGATLLGVFSVIVMVACATAGPDRAATLRRKRRLATAILITLALMTLGFASSGTTSDSAAEPDVQYALAELVYWGFLGACVVRFILLLSRYLTRHDVPSRMRWAMWLFVVAAMVCTVWVAFNIGGVVVSYLTDHRADTSAISDGLAATAAVLVAVGMAVPVAPVGCRGIVRRYRIARLLRALTPMWRELTTTVPTVLLRQAALDTDPNILLYRRVIEIRDAELILMTYAPAGIHDLVASAYPHRRSAHVAVRAEAVALSVAIDRYRAKGKPFDDSITVNDASVAAADLLREARWLVRVHRAIRTDKAVAHLRPQARALCERLES